MSGTRETVKHAAIYSAAGMMGKLIGFIMLPFYAHHLDAVGYGIIGMADASMALLSALLAYGFQAGLTRIYHEQPMDKGPVAVSTGYWIVFVITGLLVAIAMGASGPIAGLLFGDTDLALILCLALMSFFLDTCGQTAGTILTIERRSVVFSLLGLVRLVVGLTLNIVFIVILKWNVFGYFLSSALTALVSFVLLQSICFRRCGTRYEPIVAKSILAYQLPLVPSALVTFASLQSERVLLRFLGSIEKVGILEMGYKFPSLLSLLVHVPIMTSWNTERIRLAQDSGRAAAARIGDMATFSFFLVAFAGLLIALAIGDVLVILTPPAFWEAERIAQVECLTVVITCMTQHVNFGYMFSKDMKAWAKLMGSVAVLKIALSFLFISTWGILGAAYSALCAAAFVFMLGFRGGQRRYFIQFNYRRAGLIAGAALVLFAVPELLSAQLMEASRGIAAWLGRSFPALSDPGASGTTLMAREKLPYAIDALLRTAIACLFLALLPKVHPPAWEWLLQKLGRAPAKAASAA